MHTTASVTSIKDLPPRVEKENKKKKKKEKKKKKKERCRKGTNSVRKN